MSLSVGDKLGPYELLACIGEGGMGVVYKARDTRLDRMVALKVSKQDFSDRFEREARAVAALNHPHICQLYDVGPNYLVMEYVEGTPLAGPVSVAKAVEYANQILEALAHAHGKKITHRDLKPANILATRQGIKLLDFGLAKQQAGVVEDTDATVKALTAKGAILGTLQYMAPEQLHGKEADARSDIFSFGCVLYELLSGKRAFEGESAASIIGAILHQQPAPVEACQPLAGVIERCMAKEPDDRFQTARDLKYSIGAAMSGGAAPPEVRRERRKASGWTYAGLAVASLSLGFAGWMGWRERVDVIQFQLPAPAFDYRQTFAISPNGKMVAQSQFTSGSRRELYIRHLDSSEARRISGTTGVEHLAWSPDSLEIAFFADHRLRRLKVADASVEDLSGPAKFGPLGWSASGIMLFSSLENEPIFARPVAGGALTPATIVDHASGEMAHRLTSVCPDGKHFLYLVQYQDGRNAARAGVLGLPRKRVEVSRGGRPICAAAPGWFGDKQYLLAADRGMLTATQFDARAGVVGESYVLARGSTLDEGSVALSASRTGILAYRANNSVGRLTWHDRTGRVLEQLPQSASGFAPSLSADARTLVVHRTVDTRSELVVTDLERKTSMPLVLGQETAYLPVMSADGSRVAYTNGFEVRETDSAGSGSSRLLAKTPAWPQQYSPDGKHLLYVDYSKRELRMIALEGEAQPTVVAPAGPRYFPASFCSDGRFVAYTSDESGRSEVYVRAVPPASGRWLISNAGGGMAFWRGDCRELFYVSPELNMMAVDVEVAPVFRPGTARVLFQTNISGIANNRNNYVVTRDGKRFLIRTEFEGVPANLNVIYKWHLLLKRGSSGEVR